MSFIINVVFWMYRKRRLLQQLSSRASCSSSDEQSSRESLLWLFSFSKLFNNLNSNKHDELQAWKCPVQPTNDRSSFLQIFPCFSLEYFFPRVSLEVFMETLSFFLSSVTLRSSARTERQRRRFFDFFHRFFLLSLLYRLAKLSMLNDITTVEFLG